jgi:glutamate-5-semialdehyde dehydrogenase
VDAAADQDMAVRVLVDAKTQYPAVCNAAETLLVDRSIAAEFLPKAARGLAERGARLRGTAEVCELLSHVEGIPAVEPMSDDEFSTEYGNYVMSCKVVDGVREAVDHVNRYGSHHTDAIITTDDAAAEYFMQMVDSAGVYRNCSTRFADGFRYGFGAEVGISTGKLHARGPVGLDGLVTYKYRLVGHGDIVAPYASGEKSFHYRDLA